MSLNGVRHAHRLDRRADVVEADAGRGIARERADEALARRADEDGEVRERARELAHARDQLDVLLLALAEADAGVHGERLARAASSASAASKRSPEMSLTISAPAASAARATRAFVVSTEMGTGT